MNRKQLTAGALVACNVLSSGAMAFASEPVATQEAAVAGQGADVAALLTAEAAKFSVTVPTGLPINVLANGQVVVADTAYVENNSAAPIEIANVIVDSVETWALVGMDTDYTDKQVDLKEFGMEIFGADTAIENSFVAREVGVKEKLIVDYDAIVAPQTKAQNEKVADAIFTVGWVGDEVEEDTGSEDEDVVITLSDFYSYGMKEDFTGGTLSLTPEFKEALNTNSDYTVNGKTVFKAGAPLPSPGTEVLYNDMFDDAPVIDFSNLFSGLKVKSVDLSEWEFVNYFGIDFNNMFQDCTELTYVHLGSPIDLSSLRGTFYGCENLVEIDMSGLKLSSLNINNYDSDGGTYQTFDGCESLETIRVSSSDERDKLLQISTLPMATNVTIE